MPYAPRAAFPLQNAPGVKNRRNRLAGIAQRRFNHLILQDLVTLPKRWCQGMARPHGMLLKPLGLPPIHCVFCREEQMFGPASVANC